MTKKNNGPDRFELKLTNGKTRSFNTGYDMWRWAAQSNPKMEFPKEDAQGHTISPPSLSEWFERRRSK